jgi:hypothetical protein
MHRPSMGLLRRPTPGEGVEGGRLGRPCGPGALRAQSQKPTCGCAANSRFSCRRLCQAAGVTGRFVSSVVSVAGPPVLCSTTAGGLCCRGAARLQGVAAAPAASKWVVKTIALSVKVEAGTPKRATAAPKRSATIGPVTGWWAVTSRASRLWSSSQVRTSASPAGASWGPASGSWVRSAPEPGQVAADGGHRDADAVVVGEVPGDGVRPSVQARGDELAAQVGDHAGPAMPMS